MNVTAKDLEEAERQTRQLTAVIVGLTPLIRPVAWLVFRIGFVRRAAARSVGGRIGAISRCAERGEHDKAADLAIHALRAFRHQPPGRVGTGGRENWWYFMALAAENLERSGDPEKFDELLGTAKDGVEPFEGYLVARAYLAFARLKYRTGDHDAAVAFAEAAARADATWAEADYALGWYCLVLGRGDAMAHLGRAVAKDRQIVSRIADDPIWQQRPDVLERLKQLAARNGDAPAN